MDQRISAAIEDASVPERPHNLPKRVLDLALAVPAVIVALPVLAVIAAGSAIALRATPLFVQERVGLRERRFTIVKVRTLPPATPKYAAKHDLDTASVPRFTKWLRHRHLDELPQLWSVALGSMSLVGPRPEMASLHEQMPPSVGRARTQVRPGCTGLWQLSTHAAGMIHEAPEYDRFYVRHQSLRLDVWILWQTVRVLIFHRPPITLSSIPDWTIRPLRSRSATSRRALSASELRD